MNSMNIMIVGVGGQGTLLTSRVLGHVAVKKGFDVKMSEVHGMAQRGGSVVTYVKFSEKVFSPIIDKGDADVILGFEQLESLRWIDHLKKDGKLIMNTQKINPMSVISGKEPYPENIVETLTEHYENIMVIDAHEMAKNAGSMRTANIVMVGRLAQIMDIEKALWLEAIKETVPSKYLEENLKAFEAGYNFEKLTCSSIAS